MNKQLSLRNPANSADTPTTADTPAPGLPVRTNLRAGAMEDIQNALADFWSKLTSSVSADATADGDGGAAV